MGKSQTDKRTLEDVILISRIRELRIAAGLTLEEFARQIGIAQPNLSRYESGRRTPTWSIACRMADALGVSIADFRKQAETPKKKEKKK